MSGSFRFRRGHIIIPPVLILHQFPVIPIMALDTGAKLTVITPQLASEIGLETEGLKPTVKLVGISGPVWAAEVSLNRVSLFGTAVTNLKALCYALPATLGLDGILGLDFIRHFNLAINHDTETISVEASRPHD